MQSDISWHEENFQWSRAYFYGCKIAEGNCWLKYITSWTGLAIFSFFYLKRSISMQKKPVSNQFKSIKKNFLITYELVVK